MDLFVKNIKFMKCQLRNELKVITAKQRIRNEEVRMVLQLEIGVSVRVFPCDPNVAWHAYQRSINLWTHEAMESSKANGRCLNIKYLKTSSVSF